MRPDTTEALKNVVKSLGRTCNGNPTNSLSKAAPYIVRGTNKCRIEALSADFEGDLGNWTTDGQYKWALKTGRTPSGGTGPSGAYEGQYYVYVEASSPNYPSKTFNLESPTLLAGASARAIYFAYSMIGNTMGSLELQYSTGTNWTELWKVSGDKGSSWLTAAVTVPPAAVALRFQGVTGSSYRSDIGLDSIVASEFGITTPPPLSPTEALTCSSVGFTDDIAILLYYEYCASTFFV
eukprot:g20930.t1